MSMGWQAAELTVLSWAALFTLSPRDLILFISFYHPLRKVLLLSTKIKLNHYHHIGILVCRTSAEKQVEGASSFLKNTVCELEVIFSISCPYPIGQNLVTWTHLSARETRKCRGYNVFKRKRNAHWKMICHVNNSHLFITYCMLDIVQGVLYLLSHSSSWLRCRGVRYLKLGHPESGPEDLNLKSRSVRLQRPYGFYHTCLRD